MLGVRLYVVRCLDRAMNGRKTRVSPGYGYDLIAQEEHLLNTMSKLAFARHLNKRDGTKSVKGWEKAIYSYLKTNTREATKKGEPELSIPETRFYATDAYYYNKEEDTYFTFLRAADQVIKVAGETHRSMKEDYSSVATDALTINEMCRKYSFPRSWMEEYRKRHGWTHDMLPFTSEEILNGDEDVLSDELVAKKTQAVYEKFENKRWKAIEKDAMKFRVLEETLLKEFRELIPAAPAAPQRLSEPQEARNPYALVISATDFHWGKYGWVDEVGETYNFETARARLLERTEELIDKLPYSPEKVILGTGSDWFHVDNDLGQTTKGTPQDMCGSPAEILKTGCELAVEHIELLRQIAPVEIYNMAGNHDRMSALALIMYLDAYYRNCEDVTITISPHPRQYMTYGTTLIGLTHGDGGMQKLPSLMAVEAKKMWGNTNQHIWFHGHLHHQTIKETAGVMVIQMPSLAGHDRYHARAGYTMSKAGLAAYVIDKEKGLISSLFAPVVGH